MTVLLRSLIGLILFIFNSTLCSSQSLAQQWASKKNPYMGEQAQSIGQYTAGCIAGAEKLPEQGSGYQVMRLSRQRFYGHPQLIEFIKKMGYEAITQNWGTMLIGDLGQARGGPTPSGHRSHQTGLDVDIWFKLLAKGHSLIRSERENMKFNSMLSQPSLEINTKLWQQSHVLMLRTAALMPEVERIFVNPVIKQWLCKHVENHDWLQKIRPWWGHDDHFHVRLGCPIDSFDCIGQDEVPSGDGCDASLTWWFTDEARKPTVGKTVELVLPEQCNRFLTD